MLIKIILYLIFGAILLVANDGSNAQILSREILVFSGGFVLDLGFTIFDDSSNKYIRGISGLSFIIAMGYLSPFIIKLAVPNTHSRIFPFLVNIYSDILNYSGWVMVFPFLLILTDGWAKDFSFKIGKNQKKMEGEPNGA